MKYVLFMGLLCFSMMGGAQTKDTLVHFHSSIVYFDNDVYLLKENEAQKLDALIPHLSNADQIILEGHTDYKGSIAYNKVLSENRVQHVKNRLVDLGIDSSIISFDWYGELKPAEFGNDEVSNQLNRRVTLKLFRNQKRRNIVGYVAEKDTEIPLLAKIKIMGKDFIDSTYADEDGNFSIYLPDNRIYKFEIIAECHFFEQQFVKVSSQEPDTVKIELPKIEMGDRFTLPNFNFFGNQHRLLPRSVPTLDLLYQVLDQCEMCVEIEGHINLPNVPNCEIDSDHYRLSERRANMVYRNMINRGIDSTRMLPRAYGNWEMLYPKATREVDAAKNRRVEIKIIPCDNSDLQEKNKAN